MRIGIFAKTFAGSDPLTVMQEAQEAGYASVQFNLACSGLDPAPHEVPDNIIAAINSAAVVSDMAIAALSGTVNLAHPDAAHRADALQRLLNVIRVAPQIGAGIVTLCTGSRNAADQWSHHPDNATPEAWADLRQAMEPACDLAETLGVSLGIEPEPGNVIRDAAAARRLIDELRSPAPVIVLDPANLFEQPGDHMQIIHRAVELLADRIALAHAKDRGPDGGFVAAGQGVVDFPDLVARLRAVGFDGDLVTHGLRADEAPAVASYLRSLSR